MMIIEAIRPRWLGLKKMSALVSIPITVCHTMSSPPDSANTGSATTVIP